MADIRETEEYKRIYRNLKAKQKLRKRVLIQGRADREAQAAEQQSTEENV